MTISMYQASVPVFQQMLTALAAVLDKGAAFAEARRIAPTVLLQSRLAPDMLALVSQVQIATDHAKGCAARLAGAAAPSFPDDEASFPQLAERIARTLAFLDTFTPDQIDGSEERAIALPRRGGALEMTGQNYLLRFVLPNVMFHCATAFDILRHNGVDIGKRDFLGAV